MHDVNAVDSNPLQYRHSLVRIPTYIFGHSANVVLLPLFFPSNFIEREMELLWK
jgi:hypothetical protein